MTDAPMDRSEARRRLEEFLFAEFAHASASLVGNEELGDRRLSLFLAIAVAALGGIGALFIQEKPGDYLYPFAAISLAILFVLGRQTLKRILTRNCETDQLLHSLKELRKQFVELDDGKTRSLLAHDPYAKDRLPRRARPLNPLKTGGLAETTILLNSLLAGVLVAIIVAGVVPTLEPGIGKTALFAAMAIPGTTIGLLIGIVEARCAKRYYAEQEGMRKSSRKE